MRSTRLSETRTLTRLVLAFLLVIAGGLTASAGDLPFAQDCDWLSDLTPTDLWTRERLGGDLGGLRTSAGQHGIDGRIETTQFYQGVTSGGTQQQFQYGGRNDYFINVDGAKAGLLPGSSLTIHGETRYGEDVSFLTGAAIPSTIGMSFPLPAQTISGVTAFKYAQALSESLVVFGGKLNLLDDYLLNYSSGRGIDRFQNGALVFNPAVARTAPYSTLGVGAAVLQNLQPVATLVVLDAVNRPTEWGIDDTFSQGAVIIGEGRLPVTIANRPGHQIVGASWSSRQYGALSDTPLIILPPETAAVPGLESGSWSVYYNFDQTLWIDPCNPQRTWGLFGQTGIADEDTNPFRWNASFGVSGSVPWDYRPQDEFGLGYYYLGGSSTLKDALAPFLALQDGQGMELYYKFNFTKWFALTPNLQWIQPGQAAVEDAVVIGLRGKLTF